MAPKKRSPRRGSRSTAPKEKSAPSGGSAAEEPGTTVSTGPSPDGAAPALLATAREHAVMRQVRGDITDADVTACVHVLTRMLELFDDVDVD